MLGVMTDMEENRKDKVNKFRVRLDKMNKTFGDMKIEDEDLDEELREELNACFTHKV